MFFFFFCYCVSLHSNFTTDTFCPLCHPFLFLVKVKQGEELKQEAAGRRVEDSEMFVIHGNKKKRCEILSWKCLLGVILFIFIYICLFIYCWGFFSWLLWLIVAHRCCFPLDTATEFKSTNRSEGHANQCPYVTPIFNKLPMVDAVGGAWTITAEDSNGRWLRVKISMKTHIIGGKYYFRLLW